MLGRIDQGRPGPTFLVQGGIHGNEPAGVEALRRVLRELESRAIRVHGKIVACCGNLAALRQSRRFLARDLNRSWLRPAVESLLARDAAQDVDEDGEQRALLELYAECERARRGALVFVDLHTSSAEGPPFTCMADTLPNRRIADAIPVPMILGLEECIDGAVMEWFNERGQIGIAVEGGRHGDQATVDNLESAVWLAMAACGVIATADAEVARHRERLDRASRGVPHLVEIRYRHAITDAHRFQMVPGYVSFQPVARGDLLGHQADGPVRAGEDGMVLLPLYQGQGEDGFFLGRRVPRFWFALSALLRRLGLSGLVSLLPGVQRDPGDPNRLLVDPRVARYLVVQVFHLFGYRRLRPVGGKLAFSRRWAARDSGRVRPRSS
ncbi:MAG: succinylglutamate desuccinylase/aspartoacylase family protein [Planctomycetota bacterium]|nr:succinylglutamate desuccinylase/aspartoacylase family protein [Planctomycetota bacterium]MDA0934066.1 succinylglutamate desuccinylase/aspartoacylase family protein [Planctomycetota bacterium]